MLPKLRSKPILLIVIIVIGIPIFCCTSWIAVVVVRERSHDIAIRRVSNRLNIHPSWSAFELYLFSKLEVGMSKERVYAEYEKVSPYVIKKNDRGPCEVVKFRPGILNISSYELYTCYDEADTLLGNFHNNSP